MPDIKAVVQRMIDAGESEENIATVIQHMKAAPAAAPAEQKPSMVDAALADNPAFPAQFRGLQGVLRIAKRNPVATGATVGSALATGGASIPAELMLAALGGAGGAGYGMLAKGKMTGDYGTPEGNAVTMGKEGALAAAGQGAGQLANAGTKLLGRGLYKTALNPGDRVLRKYGDVVGEGLATQTPVSKAGLAQATASKGTRIATKKAALTAADQNVGFSAKLIANDASGPLSDYATKQVRAGLKDPSKKFGERLAQFQAANPDGSLTPSSLDAIKGTIDDTTGLAYRKTRMSEPLSAKEKGSIEMAQAMSRANESAVPQYKEMNRSIMDASGLQRAIKDRTVGSKGNQQLETILAALHPSSLAGRVAMVPPMLSRAGIATHVAGEHAPMPGLLKAALLAAFGSPDTPQE